MGYDEYICRDAGEWKLACSRIEDVKESLRYYIIGYKQKFSFYEEGLLELFEIFLSKEQQGFYYIMLFCIICLIFGLVQLILMCQKEVFVVFVYVKFF